MLSHVECLFCPAGEINTIASARTGWAYFSPAGLPEHSLPEGKSKPQALYVNTGVFGMTMFHNVECYTGWRGETTRSCVCHDRCCHARQTENPSIEAALRGHCRSAAASHVGDAIRTQGCRHGSRPTVRYWRLLWRLGIRPPSICALGHQYPVVTFSFPARDRRRQGGKVELKLRRSDVYLMARNTSMQSTRSCIKMHVDRYRASHHSCSRINVPSENVAYRPSVSGSGLLLVKQTPGGDQIRRPRLQSLRGAYAG